MQNEWDDNMDALELLSKPLKDIKFTKHIHPGLAADSKTTTLPEAKGNPEALYNWMMKKFGHCIMGKWQFLYEKNGKRISCIKGGVSFGHYEIYATKGFKMVDPERFETAEEALKRVREFLV